MLTDSEVKWLLYDLCTKLGFCLPPDGQRRLLEEPPKDVRSFTDAVFLAEGRDLETADEHLYAEVWSLVGAAFERSERKHSDSLTWTS